MENAIAENESVKGVATSNLFFGKKTDVKWLKIEFTPNVEVLIQIFNNQIDMARESLDDKSA